MGPEPLHPHVFGPHVALEVGDHPQLQSAKFFIAFIFPGGKRLQGVANPAFIRLTNLFLKGNVTLRTLMHLAGYFNRPKNIKTEL